MRPVFLFRPHPPAGPWMETNLKLATGKKQKFLLNFARPAAAGPLFLLILQPSPLRPAAMMRRARSLEVQTSINQGVPEGAGEGRCLPRYARYLDTETPHTVNPVGNWKTLKSERWPGVQSMLISRPRTIRCKWRRLNQQLTDSRQFQPEIRADENFLRAI
ncbi:hypothetical protein EVAR_9051_1 [Eumeta japonica]|uniref:Uncharacterized protein n=1 Tax=Eumeta variegata TaxID=151549 RepID=A0A4C1TW15_EUMVA|nr:hypothetical protein EVAR_9051_1 [Eumeta japonica]